MCNSLIFTKQKSGFSSRRELFEGVLFVFVSFSKSSNCISHEFYKQKIFRVKNFTVVKEGDFYKTFLDWAVKRKSGKGLRH